MNDCDRPVVEQVRPYVVAGRALREAGYNVLLCGPGRRRAQGLGGTGFRGFRGFRV